MNPAIENMKASVPSTFSVVQIKGTSNRGANMVAFRLVDVDGSSRSRLRRMKVRTSRPIVSVKTACVADGLLLSLLSFEVVIGLLISGSSDIVFSV